MLILSTFVFQEINTNILKYFIDFTIIIITNQSKSNSLIETTPFEIIKNVSCSERYY